MAFLRLVFVFCLLCLCFLLCSIVATVLVVSPVTVIVAEYFHCSLCYSLSPIFRKYVVVIAAFNILGISIVAVVVVIIVIVA